MQLIFSILKSEILKAAPKQGLTKNGDMKVEQNCMQNFEIRGPADIPMQIRLKWKTIWTILSFLR
jgi:hypothetical protein